MIFEFHVGRRKSGEEPESETQIQLGATSNYYCSKQLWLLQRLLGEPGIEVEKEGFFVGWNSSDQDGLSGENGTKPAPSLAQVPQSTSRAGVLARDTGQAFCHLRSSQTRL